MVSQARMDQIYDMDKVLEEDWQWEHRGSNIRGEGVVQCLDEELYLTLKAWKRKETDKYAFSLLYKTSKTVRRWDKSTPHKNPDGEVLEDPHKHYWTEEHEDGFAYPVDDVTTSNFDEAFFDFLEESNIEHNGQYQSHLEAYND